MSGSGMSFGGGFASGLATVLSQKRQEDNRKSEQQIQNNWKLLSTLLNSGQVGDIADIQPFLDTMDLGLPKSKGKQGGPGDHVTNILGHIIRNQNGQATGRADTNAPVPATGLPSQGSVQSQGPTGPDDMGQMQPPTELQSKPLTMAPAPPAPRRTVMGIPLLTPEERATREVDLQTQALGSQVEARRRIAERLGLTGDHAQRFALTGQFPIDPLDRIRPQSVAGEVMNPQTGAWEPAFAVFSGGRYVDPDTGQPVENFRPRSTTGSMSLGADREALARELFGKRAADLNPEEMTKVNTTAQERAAGKAGAVTSARAQAEATAPLSTAKSVDVQRQLQEDWTKANASVKETKRQYDIMQTGLKRFKAGDKIGGSQAVLVTFQKILDPNSVVRESEYDRSTEGLGLKDRMIGYIERLKEGGAGVPAEDLEAMVQTAKEFVDGMNHYNDDMRRRLTLTARKANLNPTDIFGEETATPTAPAKAGAATTTVPATKKVGGAWVISVP